jgi:hypothetical protein
VVCILDKVGNELKLIFRQSPKHSVLKYKCSVYYYTMVIGLQVKRLVSTQWFQSGQ